VIGAEVGVEDGREGGAKRGWEGAVALCSDEVRGTSIPQLLGTAVSAWPHAPSTDLASEEREGRGRQQRCVGVDVLCRGRQAARGLAGCPPA
jgi:hypothetical protein